ncbi:peptidase M24 [Alicyclobacillus cellulosilyticus]|uniref:Peptidase M24 n=1 Tax=Alicyclobacillus cellulosilyticus TaxID=1003997 RepID=A0A917K8X6_9BACL|nr:M24 family metallopeptidase [Alicyclobacillus cellulosilyticus]GGJ02064.1 peptidase M24 [Alicyclobacillus cellulosilyticus]
MRLRAEFDEKVARVRRLAEEKKLDGILIAGVANFRWLSSGALNVVSRQAVQGEVALYVTQDAVHLLANVIEMPRLLEQDFTGLPVEAHVFPWYQSLAEQVWKLPGSRRGSDIPLPGLVALGDEVRSLRYPMTSYEVERYMELGRDAARVIEDVMAGVQPGMTGRQIMAKVDGALLEAGILPIVSLVGIDDPVLKYRHPIPNDRPFHHTAMMVSCAERHGLIVALTRTVHNGRLSDEARQHHHRVQRVLSEMVAATKPGRKVADVLSHAQAVYERLGYPGEWQKHHQGGGIGYETRDFIATPQSTEVVHSGQAFAWNPSIPGYKAEDTFLITDSGPVLVTASGGPWPRSEITVGELTLSQADILEL